MSTTTSARRPPRELSLGAPADELCGALRRAQSCTLLLDGPGPAGDGWAVGPLLALDPACHVWERGRGAEGLDELGRLVAERRAVGGTAETGVAALLSYELLDADRRPGEPMPDVVVVAVDHSLRFLGEGRLRLASRTSCEHDDLERRLGDRLRAARARRPAPAARIAGPPHTSLPREAYCAAVARVLEHIGRGDIYQANLCQVFEIDFSGDPFEAYRLLARSTPAPHAAYLEVPGLALASVSPETFLRGSPDGRLETRPIKGTRPRGATPAEDAAQAAALVDSAKDRAELVMIVDLERNDLSRVCLPGTVEVPEACALRSYPAVHHLVARVRGRRAPGVGVADLVRATFPGGSISGAPKRRALEILRALEPAPRGFFTGCLCWFGDDGSLDASILIRSWVFGRERAWLGAGGGVVADSDPLGEWRESNHKARALARALGFEPEDAA